MMRALLLSLCVAACASGVTSKSEPAPVVVPVASVSAAPPEVASTPTPLPELLPLVRARVSQARVDCIVIHAVAEKWRADHPGDCPSATRLRDEKELAATSKVTDPWGTLYAIRCADDDTFVSSAGPDGRFGTPDDVVAPSKILVE